MTKPSPRTRLRQQASLSSDEAAAVAGVRAARYLAWERGVGRLRTRQSERLVRSIRERVNHNPFWIPMTQIRLSLVLNDRGIELLDWLWQLKKAEKCLGCLRMFYEPE